VIVVKFVNKSRVLIFSAVKKVSGFLEVVSVLVNELLSLVLPGGSINNVLIFLTFDGTSMFLVSLS
jgi:hypothetical protein